MAEDKDERKRPQLRLVVNNAEKRHPGPAAADADFIPLERLVAQRDTFRAEFYRGLGGWETKAYAALERFLGQNKWPYGLDPHLGSFMVLPAAVVCPELLTHGGLPQDELLLFVADDLTGKGLCLSLETILPYYSDDDAVMEDALLYAPVLPYGSLFLEENRQDGFLDLIYRLAFPLYPPALTASLTDRLFAVAALELRETLHALTEYPQE